MLSNAGITGSQSEPVRTLDFNNPAYDLTRADFDIHHTFHLNAVYEFPVGRGRRWLSNSVMGRVLEGWQTGGLWTWRSGIPITLTSGIGTINRTGNSTGNPAVAIGVSDRSICNSVGVYETPASGALFLPASDIAFNTSTTAAPGSTLGANTSVWRTPVPVRSAITDSTRPAPGRISSRST